MYLVQVVRHAFKQTQVVYALYMPMLIVVTLLATFFIDKSFSRVVYDAD